MEQIDNIGVLIKRIHGEIGKSFCAIHGGESLSFSQLRVLLALYPKQDTGLTQKELELMLGVSHPTIVGIIQRLELKGLVRCCVDDKDKRMKRVYPTEISIGQHDRVEQHKRYAEEAILRGMSPGDVETLRRLLQLAYQNALNMNEKKAIGDETV